MTEDFAYSAFLSENMEKAEDAQHQKRAETFMRLALAQAERAHELGEVPVGCVVVYCGSDESGELASCKPDTVIGTGFNRTNITHNVRYISTCLCAKSLMRSNLQATRHAEFEAVDMILMRSGGRYTTDIFKHCELYVAVYAFVFVLSLIRSVHTLADL